MIDERRELDSSAAQPGYETNHFGNVTRSQSDVDRANDKSKVKEQRIKELEDLWVDPSTAEGIARMQQISDALGWNDLRRTI